MGAVAYSTTHCCVTIAFFGHRAKQARQMINSNLKLNEKQSAALVEVPSGVLFQGTVRYEDEQEQEFSALGDIWDQLVPHAPIERWGITESF